MTSIGTNKNKLFNCFRPSAADDLKPPLYMHITAVTKQKTVKFKVLPDSTDDHINGGCWGVYKKKKKTKKKTSPRRRLSSLLKRVLFDSKLIKRCCRNTETEENSTKKISIVSDKTPPTHVSVSLEKINRPPSLAAAAAAALIEKKDEKFYNPCVGMSLILVPLIVLIMWGKGFAILSASICLYLIPGMLKGGVAELSRERNDELKKVEGRLERETRRNWRRVN